MIHLPNHGFEDMNELLHSMGLSQTVLEVASYKVANRIKVVLKRQPDSVWINQYNPDLLRAWNANLDVHVTDAYSCGVYNYGSL